MAAPTAIFSITSLMTRGIESDAPVLIKASMNEMSSFPVGGVVSNHNFLNEK